MRPSYLSINLSNLSHNTKLIKNLVYPAKVLAVVKANAYGHGLIECARVFEKDGVDFLGVAFVEEGIELREAGIKMPIVAFGGISSEQIELFIDHSIDCLASSVDKLNNIISVAKAKNIKARVHLKIDTGMSRIGINHESPQLEKLISDSFSSPHIECIGIMSHFSDSELEDQEFTELQLHRFNKCLSPFNSNLKENTLLHIANSGAILSDKKYHLSMVRPGRILYGISPADHLNKVLDLKQVLSLRSEAAYFKVIKKGTPVSYGRTWTAPHDTRLVTIPLGYADGIPRDLSNKGEVIIRGNKYPIVGTICMDQFMVDIGPDGEVYNGDSVTIIGNDYNMSVYINDIAKQINAEPLELLTRLNTRLPRKFTY